MYERTCVCTYVRRYVRARVRTYVHTYVYYIHTYARPYIRTYVCTYVRTYVHCIGLVKKRTFLVRHWITFLRSGILKKDRFESSTRWYFLFISVSGFRWLSTCMHACMHSEACRYHHRTREQNSLCPIQPLYRFFVSVVCQWKSNVLRESSDNNVLARLGRAG